ncbi:hypothetical protein WICPIJ_007820 [Wickerhamomyces pijperi]|uniref:Vacuolar protein sorting-associated protein 29 n=1 Tax=Wickerhamomyces pijperi TaxID=599730 RepID=A0A9P8Q1P9_WICPI|nr:hypothetical protein WICPIJ_007820 [Wickerhamomyces pijperi]
MLVLAIGDLHIPHRAISIPYEHPHRANTNNRIFSKFKKLLTPGKISQVLCLGNTTTSPSTLAFLQSLSPDFQLVKGEFDIATPSSLPLSLIVTHGSLRIGFLNGFTVIPRGDPLSLLTLARQWNVDVLIWGNGAGVEAYTLEGKFFVNPGSATGAWCGEWEGEEEVDDENVTDKVAKLQVKDDEEPVKEESKEDKSHETKDQEKEKEVKPEELNKEPTASSPITNQSKDTQKEKEAEEEDSESESESEYDANDLYDTIPSFTLLDIQGTSITLYIYTLINGEVKVDKVSYRKPAQLE